MGRRKVHVMERYKEIISAEIRLLNLQISSADFAIAQAENELREIRRQRAIAKKLVERYQSWL